MHTVRRSLASIVLTVLVLSLVTSDGQILSATSPAATNIVDATKSVFHPTADDRVLIAFGPQKTGTISVSQQARTDLRMRSAVHAILNSIPAHRSAPAVFTEQNFGSLYAFGPARQNQVLTFIDGRIVWANPQTSVSGDFMANPGSGRKPASDLSGSNRHYGTGNANASATTTTTTSSGLSTSEADSRYVNIAGDTMNGALVIDYNGLALNITGTASGDVLHAERLLTVTGAAIFDGNARFNSTLTINAVTYSFPASDGASSGKVLKTNAAGQLSWADDNAVGVGLSQSSGDARYVNQSGDTMTGALVINLSSGTLGLRILQTASGNILHAEKDLTSSGTLTVVGTTTLKSSVNVSGTISGQTLTIMNGQSSFLGSVGIGTTSPKAKLEVQGTLSGARLFVSTAFSGAGLSSCSGAGQKLLWNSTTQQFSCSTDQTTAQSAFSTGNVLTLGDARYLRTSGGTMTGALVINLSSGTLGLRILQTASGNILHAEKDLTSSGTLTVVGVSRFKNNLNVVGTVSGSALTVMNGTSYVLGSLGIGTTSPKAKLDVSGTISGTTLVISRNGSFSGSLIVTSSIQTRGSLSGSTISGFALGSCNGSSQKLLYNNTTHTFECGSDQTGTQNSFGTGNVITIGDARYVNTSGDTMTGALVINLTSGSLGLKIISTASGNILHAEKDLTSSGTLTVVGVSRFKNNLNVVGTVSGAALTVMNGTSYVLGSLGIGTTSPKAKLEVLGSFSGSRLYAASAFSGAGLTTCSGAGQKLLWNSTTQQFSCGTDLTLTFGTGNVLTLGDARYVNTAGDTMTGALTIALSSGTLGTVGLNVLSTISGAVIHAEKTLTSSGGLVFEGAASGSSLYLVSSFRGAGLTDCTGSNKLLWNASTGRFSCGVDQSSGTGLDQNTADARYVNTSGDTMTGALVINLTSGSLGLRILQTASGNILHAEKDLTSSGTLTIVGVSRFKNNLNVVGTVSGAALTVMNGTSYVLGSLGIGTTSPKAKLEVLGSFSGSRLYAASAFSGAGLTTCSGAGQKLLWNSTTQQFSCGTDLNTVFGTGNVLTLGDARYLRTSGGTMTGALVINLSSGTLGLRILQTASGNILHAEKDLTSSGTLTVVGVSRFKNNLNVVGTVSGSALTVMNGTSYVLGSFGIGTTSPKAKLDVSGTISGTTLVISRNGSFSGTLIVVSGITTRGTLSGSNLTVSRGASISGTLLVRTGITTKGSLSGATIGGFALGSCNGASQKLLYNNSTQKFECGSDQTGAAAFGTGNVLTVGDARYVKKQGDTMTGALVINLSTGTLGLRILQTASGNIIHAEKSLTSSGIIAVTQRSAQGSGALVVVQLANSTGVYIQGSGAHVNAPLLVLDSSTGSARAPHILFGYKGTFDVSLYRTTGAVLNLSGHLLPSLTNKFDLGSTSARWRSLYLSGGTLYLGNSSNQASINFNTSSSRFGVDSNTDGTNELSILSTGNVGIGTQAPKAKLDVQGTISGSNLVISRSASISGTLLVKTSIVSKGSLSGVTISGFALGSCNNASTSKLLYNNSTQQFECGTDQNSSGLSYSAASGIFLKKSGGTMTGALVINLSSGTLGLRIIQTASGNIIHAEKSLSSSGTIIATGTIATKSTLSGAALTVMNGNSYFLGSLGIGMSTTPKAKLDVLGTLSGKSLVVSGNGAFSGSLTVKNNLSGSALFSFGLGSCSNSSSSKLLYNNSTGKFSCGTDQTGGSNAVNSGGVLTIGDARYVKKQGDTMTGTLKSPGFLLASGTTLVEMSGWNESLNLIHSGLMTNSVTRLTKEGDLKNIGTVQAGEANFRRGGTFLPKTDYATGSNPNEVAIGDLNGDGKSEMVVVNNASDTVSVFIGTGSGLFVTKVDYATGAGPVSVSIGDLNGDGKPDLAVANQAPTNSVSIFLNKGNGTFATKVDYTTGSNPLSVSVGDLNGDGSVDLVIINNLSATVSILLNYGRGTFAPKVDYATATNPSSVAIADVNGDGKADLAVANGNSNSVSIFMNNGNGTFATKVDYTTGSLTQSVTVADFNGDKRNDLAVTNWSSDTFSVLLNLGSGTFAAKVDYATGANPRGIRAGDVNGDGVPDVAISNQNADMISLFLNNGNGTFATKVDYTTGTNPYGVAMGDLNGDGKLDLATVDHGSASVSVFLNNSKSILYASAGTGGAVGIGTSTPNSALSVSGAVIISRLGTLGNGSADAGLALEIIGTMSGRVIHAQDLLTSSGTLIVEGTMSGATFQGAGLGSCSGASQKLLYNNSTKKFECGADLGGSVFGTGNVLAVGDNRYLRTSGGTLTGTLTIGLTSGFLGLKIVNTASGNIIHAEKSLSSSGTILATGNITSKSSLSGAALFVGGMTDCTNATTSKVLYNVSTGKFSCGTDQTAAGLTYSSANGIFVNQSGDTMTGALTINLTSGSLGLKIINTASGNIIHAEKTLTSSGNIIAGTDIVARGTIKSDAVVFTSGTTLAEMSGWNEYLNIVHSGLGTSSVTRLTQNGDLVNIGTIQSGEANFRRGGTFLPKTDYATGSGPNGVAIGDLNGDGKMDVVIANTSANTVSVLLGTGSGLLTAKVDYATGTLPQNVAIGDLNGDGKPDLAVANYTGGNSVSVLLNNGNGTFATKVDYPTGTSSAAVAIVDLNGDGKQDLAITNYGSNSVSVLLNNGNGTFATKVDYTTGTAPLAIATADLNGDGKPDLAITNTTAASVSVLFNNGNGTFAAKVDYTVGSSPQGIVAVDLNGDKKADLAVSNGTSNSVSVLLNNGNGTFATKVDYTTGGTPQNVAAGDVNGDGKADLAVPNNSDNTVSIFLNNGNGTFAAKADYTTANAPIFVALGDLNADGKPDLAVANNSSASVSVLLNNSKSILYASAGTGGAVGIGTSTPGSALAVSGAVIISRLGNLANIRADSDVTLEVIGTASGRVLHAQDSLTSSGSLIVEGTMSGATFQGAGLGSCNGTTQKLLYNNSTKKFECGTDLGGSFSTGNVLTIGDARYVRTSGGTMTGALTINLTSGSLGLKIINTASGNIIHAEKTLTSSGNIIAGTDIVAKGTMKADALVFSSGTTLAEMSGWNEYLNVVHSGIGTNSVTRMTKDGNLVNIGTIQSGEAHFRRGGTFLPKVDYTAGTAPFFVAIGDLNGDGKSDLVVANKDANSISVFIGTGAGLFVSKVDYTTSASPRSLSIGDLNGDGKPDIAVGSYTDLVVSIFINKGDGTLLPKVDYSIGYAAFSVVIADLNGDGKSDLAATGASDAFVSVLLNNGNGTFAPKSDYATGGTPTSVIINDFNGDGKADLAVANNAGTTVSVLMGNGNGTFATKIDYTVGTQPISVASGDLNGDRKPDLVVANVSSDTASVLLNNGNGTFATKVDYATGAFPYFVAIADINGDGNQDYVTANANSSTVSTFLNNGNGTFATKVDYVTGTTPRSVAVGDLNGDGKADIVSANDSTNNISVFLNDSRTILYASSGTGGAVGIGTSTPGSALAVSGAVLINSIGNITNTRADVGLALEIVGTASGRTLHAQDLLRSSGSLAIEKTAYFGSGVFIQTRHTRAADNVLTIITDYSSTNNTVFRITASGAVYADARYNSAGADYAEWFATKDTLTPGEVVCIDPLHNNSVSRCTRSGDPNVMGIVSTNPAFVGNVISGAEGLIPPGYALIGLIGQVPAKPSLENGQIFPGDSVTSATTPGFIRKASAGESTVGVALEAFDGSQTTINVLISRRNQSLTVETLEQKVLDQIASMNLTDQIAQLVNQAAINLNIDDRVTEALNNQLQTFDLASEVNTLVDDHLSRLRSGSGGQAGTLSFGQTLTGADLTTLANAVAAKLATTNSEQEAATGSSIQNDESRIMNYESRLEDIENKFSILNSQFLILSGSGQTSTGSLHAAALTLSSGATINGTLRLSGALILSSSSSQLGPINLSGSAVTIGSLMSTGALTVLGNVTISGLAEFLGDVHIRGELVLSSRQAGFAVIPASGTAVTVTFPRAMTGMPIVNASPDTPVLYAVTKVSATGFTIRIGEVLTTDIRFSYVAISADQPKTSVGISSSTASSSLIPFPVNTLGQPVSSDPVWNGCIQGRPLKDSDGVPFSCSRYHQDRTWEHPDLHIGFIYNPNHDPAILTIPEGYQVVVISEEGQQTPVTSTEADGATDIPEVVNDTGSVVTSQTGSTIESLAVSASSGSEIPVSETVSNSGGVVQTSSPELVLESASGSVTGTGTVLLEE